MLCIVIMLWTWSLKLYKKVTALCSCHFLFRNLATANLFATFQYDRRLAGYSWLRTMSTALRKWIDGRITMKSASDLYVFWRQRRYDAIASSMLQAIDDWRVPLAELAALSQRVVNQRLWRSNMCAPTPCLTTHSQAAFVLSFSRWRWH